MENRMDDLFDSEEQHADNEPPVEWELARYTVEEEVPFDIPRD